MLKKITEEQRNEMRFRRRVIKDKLRNIEALITGRTANFKKIISDEDGKLSAAKTEKFINDMLASLMHYKNGELGKESLKMYESFLYCAVTGLCFERSHRTRFARYWKRSETFADIIALAEKTGLNEIGSYNDYLAKCYCYHRELKKGEHMSKFCGLDTWVSVEDPIYFLNETDFFIGVKESLCKLGFPVLVKCIPKDTLEKLRLFYEENVPYSAEKFEPLNVPELWVKKTEENYPDDNFEEEPEFKDDQNIYDDEDDYDYFDYEHDLYSQWLVDNADEIAEYYQELEDENQIEENLGGLKSDQQYSENNILKHYSYEKLEKAELKKSEEQFESAAFGWSNSLYDKRLLCKHFFRFLYLFFDDPNRRSFVSDIENMADTFLFEHGLSAFSLGEDFAMINHYIDQTGNRIDRELRRDK